MLLGTVEYLGTRYIYMESSFVKGSRQMILVSETDLDEINFLPRLDNYYRAGGVLEENYLIGILDPVRAKKYGSVQLLDLIYKEINDILRQSRLAQSYNMNMGLESFKFENSEIVKNCGSTEHISIRKDNLVVEASLVTKLNIKPRALGKLLVDIPKTTGKYNTSTFLDASLEYLERQGFDTKWYTEGQKKYIPIHSMKDWRELVIPAFIRAYTRWKKEKYFKYFVVAIDFESTGLDAFCEKAKSRDHAVYFSISFEDHESFGVFVDMENFDNVDREEMAEALTYMTQRDPLVDRDLEFSSGIMHMACKRSDLLITAHNMMIDRRFGFTMGADVWFDLCTMQLGFNLDPFMTRGQNGLKYNVEKFFNVSYPDLRDICGPKNQGMFRYLSDKRVVMMYGCADTDFLRLYAIKLMEGVWQCIDYYKVDHVKKHMELDVIYMNSKADNDYQGIRIDLEAHKKEKAELDRVVALYNGFMADYVGRVQEYKVFESVVLAAERHGIALTDLKAPDLDKSNPYLIKKWSGGHLIKVLFEVLGYPKLVWTEQNKKAKLAGKPFKPKLAVNVEAIEYYLKIPAVAKPEEIEAAMRNPQTLEELKLSGMYLKTDFIDPVTNAVLISKDEFNSFRFPMFQVLLKLSPILKKLSSELNSVVENDSEYRFETCNTTSAVTRRDLNPLQTTSKKGKYYFLPYTDDYNNCDVDQSAVEIRILYGISKDRRLIDPIQNPENDSHTEAAALMHQKPAYLIDYDERKGIKFLNFGIPYGKEVYSSCKTFFGDNSEEHMAIMYKLFQLYDEKMHSVMEALNKVRDEMDVPVDAPEFLRFFLEMDPEKKYGRMINDFGYAQHMEIREGDEGFRQAMRRKAGNFIIQGFAANFIRMLYTRMFNMFWKKGWIQNRMIRLHLTVHDEVLFSYHKTLPPMEVMEVMQKAWTVDVKGFPRFFIGMNFGHSWGQAKEDSSELPVLLVEELLSEYNAGKHRESMEEDHIKFFAERRKDYMERRVKRELLEINKGRNVWDINYLNDAFTNYNVRSTMNSIVPGGTKLPKKCDDPILILCNSLPMFVARYLLDPENPQYVIYKRKKYLITEKMREGGYETIEDYLSGNNNSLKKEEEKEHSNQMSLMDDFDFEPSLEDDLYGSFDFDPEEQGGKQLDDDGQISLSTSFLLSYNKFNLPGEEVKKRYSSLEERIAVESKVTTLPKFNNFQIAADRVIIDVPSPTTLVGLRKFCLNKASTRTSAVSVFVRHGGKLLKVGKFDVEFLHGLDTALTEKFK